MPRRTGRTAAVLTSLLLAALPSTGRAAATAPPVTYRNPVTSGVVDTFPTRR